MDPPAYIGSTPQSNTPPQPATRAGWAAFQAESRLACMRGRLPPTAAELRRAIDAVIAAVSRLLNHAVLFGGGYVRQALRLARSLA